MDTMKKYLARSFFFLLYQFLCTRYQNVEIVFIAHHTEAHEVTEEEFFHKGESGGTFISSGYNKALEIIDERYHPALWNVYAFHCSDGDNFDSDNAAALKAAQELTQDLQSVRLRRNQTAGLRLLRQHDDSVFLADSGGQFPNRADSTQRRHLDFLQNLSEQRPRARRRRLTRFAMTTCYSVEDLERWNERIVELGRTIRSRSVSPGIRDLRPRRHVVLHGLFGHAVALSALVLWKNLRKAQNSLRLRRERACLTRW